jgi:NTE family protein
MSIIDVDRPVGAAGIAVGTNGVFELRSPRVVLRSQAYRGAPEAPAVSRMNRLRLLLPVALAALLALGGCATRPVNPPIAQADPDTGYRFATRQAYLKAPETLVILAFSGGGTRAAAFSYGVLEFLRRTEIVRANGEKVRLLDGVGVITGVSGGSFTALAYGLYGDQLFADYEQRFLKRDVQGELIARFLSPAYWGNLWFTRWGRAEMAADLYDEILFNGATFADLDRGTGPLILASATDLSTGARLVFDQNVFDAMCSNLGAVRLSRAAAASSAVPVVFSPVTLDNYGGACNYAASSWPSWLQQMKGPAGSPRPSTRAKREIDERLAFADGAHRPYIHLVDGGVADNVGMRSVLTVLELMEAAQRAGVPTRLDRARRIVVFVVNSVSAPRTHWDESETPPGIVSTLLQASSVPIDHYSYESIDLLRDKQARWQSLRRLRQSAAFARSKDPAIADELKGPEVDIFAIDVSFAALKDKAEFEYLNGLPTTFVLPEEAVDRLRAAAGTIIMASPEFQRLLKEVGAKIVPEPSSVGSTSSPAQLAVPMAAPVDR